MPQPANELLIIKKLFLYCGYLQNESKLAPVVCLNTFTVNELSMKDIENLPRVFDLFCACVEGEGNFFYFSPSELTVRALSHNLIYVADKTQTAAVSKLLLSEKPRNRFQLLP